MTRRVLELLKNLVDISLDILVDIIVDINRKPKYNKTNTIRMGTIRRHTKDTNCNIIMEVVAIPINSIALHFRCDRVVGILTFAWLFMFVAVTALNNIRL